MNNSYKLRSGIVFLFFCSCYIVIVINLYIIQIKQQNFFSHLAQQQYQISLTTLPPRALIEDRNGIPLALNKDSLSAFIMPRSISAIERLEPFLKKYFPQALERLYHHKDAHFVYVKRKLNEEILELIKQHNILDIHILKEPSRWYPHDYMAPIIGITDIDNRGLFGIEHIYDQQLAGVASTQIIEKDARSGQFYFSKEVKVQGNPGLPVRLTLDAHLQFLVHEDLKQSVEKFSAQEGSVLILNPSTGEILAMAYYPTFDPNNTEHLSIDLTQNKIVTHTYELGSVIKVFAAIAALEEHVVTPDEIIDCQNTKIGHIDGFKISTWKAHDKIPFSQVIAQSNNLGIATVTKRLGSKLYDHYKRLGFGSKTGLQWPGEQAGFINAPEHWSRQSIISLSFGYEITANLLQLGLAYCVIANNGHSVKPKIVLDSQLPELSDKPLYSAETMQCINEILEKPNVIAIPGIKIRGKTGTANLAINGEYSKEHNIYTFAGIIEKDDYKRVIITFIKDIKQPGLYAASVAMPLFVKVAENLIIHDKLVK